ncbi:MAG: hypothetical protein ACTH31_16880 [Pseudoclavibacter sp.]
MNAPPHTRSQAPGTRSLGNETRSIRPRLLLAVGAELVKLWSLRSNRTLLAAAVVMIGGSGAMLSLAHLSRIEDPRFAGETITVTATQFVDSVLWAQVLVAIVAVLAVTGEYTSGSVRLSLLALPTRLPWLGAKALVLAAAGFVVGLVGTSISYGASAAILSSSEVVYDVALGDAARLCAYSGLYLAAIAALSVAVAALLRGVVVALLGTLAMLVVLPPIVGSIPPIAAAADFLPTIAGRRLISDFATAAELTPIAGFGVLLAWVCTALLTSGVLLVRRDA